MRLKLLAIAVGCKPEEHWVLDYRPLTQEERTAVDNHVRAVLCATQHDLTLSGKKQDWDDYAIAVYDQTRKSLCPPRLFQRIEWDETGKWKAYDAEPTSTTPQP